MVVYIIGDAHSYLAISRRVAESHILTYGKYLRHNVYIHAWIWYMANARVVHIRKSYYQW